MNIENFHLTKIKLKDFFKYLAEINNLQGVVDIVFLGSQSILYYYENISNDFVLSSVEIDIKLNFEESLRENKEAINKILDQLDFSYGLQSQLHDNEFFYIDLNTSDYEEIENQFNKWPLGWRERAKQEYFYFKGFTLKFTHPDYHDICALKMIAYREKDLEYVKTLVQGSILRKKKLLKSIKLIPSDDSKQKIRSIAKVKSFYKLPSINIQKGA